MYRERVEMLGWDVLIKHKQFAVELTSLHMISKME